jgi:uncharacterized protein (TIGR02270 family)
MNAHVEPLPELIDESFEEATFLWSRWEADLSSISRNLDEVWTWTEDRLGGALDGVKLASDSILERLARTALNDGNRHALSVCGHVLATAAAPNSRTILAALLRASTGDKLAALVRGIEVAPLDSSFAPITKFLTKNGPEHAAALARLKAFRRAELGAELTTAFESNVAHLQAAALRAARQLPAQYAAAWVDAGLKHDDPAVRLAAAMTGLKHRIPNAWAAALAAARKPRPEFAALLGPVAMLGGDAEYQLIYSALAEPPVRQAAIWALGNIGTRDAAAYCIAALKHPELAKAAGEAYCAITGADLARDRLTKPEPDEAAPAFEADDLDANLVPTPAEQWPLPNPDALRQHWNNGQARFQNGVRYVRGKPATLEALMGAVETAPMLRRPDYVFELYVSSGGKYDVEPRTTRAVQRQMMTVGRGRLTEPAVS